MIDLDDFADAFLDKDAFAEEATYRPAGRPGVTIPIHFMDEFQELTGLGEAGVESSSPVAECKTSDLEEAAKGNQGRGDTLVARGDIYTVESIRPSKSTGMTLLILSKEN